MAAAATSVRAVGAGAIVFQRPTLGDDSFAATGMEAGRIRAMTRAVRGITCRDGLDAMHGAMAARETKADTAGRRRAKPNSRRRGRRMAQSIRHRPRAIQRSADA